MDKNMPNNDTQAPLRGTPQREYTDPAVFDQELADVFGNDWVMVGRQGCIPEPGSYLTASIGKRPIVCIRQKDGSIRAFANFCLHRYAKLLDGRGKAGRIVCPYHAWTYEITGRLIGISEPKGFGNACKSEMGLKELACEVWLGFIFVALRHDLPPMAEKLAPLASHLAHYDLSTYEDRYVFDEEEWDGQLEAGLREFRRVLPCHLCAPAVDRADQPDLARRTGPMSQAQFSVHYNPYRPEDLPEVHNPDARCG